MTLNKVEKLSLYDILEEYKSIHLLYLLSRENFDKFNDNSRYNYYHYVIALAKSVSFISNAGLLEEMTNRLGATLNSIKETIDNEVFNTIIDDDVISLTFDHVYWMFIIILTNNHLLEVTLSTIEETVKSN